MKRKKVKNGDEIKVEDAECVDAEDTRLVKSQMTLGTNLSLFFSHLRTSLGLCRFLPDKDNVFYCLARRRIKKQVMLYTRNAINSYDIIFLREEMDIV